MSVQDIQWPTDQEVRAVFDPLVIRRFARSDPEWAAIENDNAKRQHRARVRRRLVGWIPALRRTQASVEANYSRQWQDRPLDMQVDFAGAGVPFVWRDDHLLARAVAIKRVHLLYLMRAIAALQPRAVLEVGCGNGFNLFMLAGRFPALRCFGVELTPGGVEAARRVASQGSLSAAVQRFTPEPLVDLSPFRRVHITRGNAANLPLASSSVDMVMTMLALEQMEPIRERALAELRRVARAHVAMVEPFRDWNEEGCTRDYVIANDYFSGRIADLTRLGLDPVFASADMPAKLANRPGLVVCRVA